MKVKIKRVEWSGGIGYFVDDSSSQMFDELRRGLAQGGGEVTVRTIAEVEVPSQERQVNLLKERLDRVVEEELFLGKIIGVKVEFAESDDEKEVAQ